MRNNIIFFLLVFLISVSCQKDSIPVSVVDGDKSIVCQVSVMGANDTKSLEVTKDLLKQYGFRMDAWLEAQNRDRRSDLWPQLDENPHYIKDANITYTGGEWKSSVDTVFWTNQIWTNFWAQYPYSAAGRGDLSWAGISDEQQKTPSFTYDMSACLDTVEASRGRASEVTSDLLVAYSKVRYDVDADTTQPSEGVYFKFAHALSAIKFTKHPNSGVDYSIDSIRITGIYSKGECHLSGLPASGTSPDSVSVSWVGTGTLDSGIGFSQFTDFPNKDTTTYIFLIPQELKSEARLIAKVSAREDEGNKKWCDVNIGGQGQKWRPGLTYNYKVKYDALKNYLTVTVDEEGYYIEPGVWNEE